MSQSNKGKWYRRKQKIKTAMSPEMKKLSEINKCLVAKDNNKSFAEPLIAKEPSTRENLMEDYYQQAGSFMNNLRKIENPRTNYIDDIDVQIPKYISTSQSAHMTLKETIDYLAKYLKADGYTFYIAENDEIFRYYDDTLDKWSIGAGSIVAAFVAWCQECLLINRENFENALYPLGLGRKLGSEKSALIIPVVSPAHEVVAVFEFTNNIASEPFTKSDMNFSNTLASWVAAGLHWKERKSIFYHTRNCDILLQSYLRQLLIGESSPSRVIADCMMALISFTYAKKVIYYSNVSDNKYRMHIFTKENDVVMREIKTTDIKSDDIMYKCLSDESLIDLSDLHINDSDPIPPGRNPIVIIPLGLRGKVIGFVRMQNKMEANPFTEEDEALAFSAGAYCTAAVGFSAFSSEILKMRETVARQEKTVGFHLRPCEHDLEFFSNKQHAQLPTNFTTFSWYPKQSQMKNLADYMYRMYRDLFYNDPLMKKIHLFVLVCQKGYRPMHYHNFEHAFTATHCMYCIIKSSPENFNYLEQVALMIAISCHDIDHPGCTNTFLGSTKANLSQLYRESYLENHHSSITKIVIKQTGILSHLSKADYKRVVDEVTTLILATDLKSFVKSKLTIIELTQKGLFFKETTKHKAMLKTLMMTACDLSGQCKPYNTTTKITYNLYKEFYHEGDRLLELGIEPMSIMNRKKWENIPADQVYFLNEVVIPCCTALNEILPGTAELLNNCSAVCDKWTIEAEKKNSTDSYQSLATPPST